ncbi:DUF92 domain-containing protein [Paenibacillus albicereus]|uniref:DUF92 domain-containing protein n=1 Tax=Paenibacillus albicereus TaxID=2726185 RepID=A0A6H2GVX1_9BACL|nr:DUF92 domain-containing protein [Paenibacillus albicereus]QJC51574.1 DUF92 domain-containing protein [Paenibacillus albicereus]
MDAWSLLDGQPLLRLAAAAAGAALIAGAAWRLRALSGSGAIAAAGLGTGYVALGGPFWFGLLLAFFVSSTLWSKWKKHHRAKAGAERNYAKGSRRDAGQVLANGGAGLLACAAYAVWPEPWLALAYVGVIASVNADTWATEIGALSRSLPRSVRTLRRVPAGTSGGITPLGTTAALLGGAFIGAAGALLAAAAPLGWGAAAAAPSPSPVALLAAGALAGLAGALADSWLGATAQAMYRCRSCGSETERAEHCGRPAERVRGFAWMTNDAVNLVSSLLAGALGAAIALLA